MGPHESALRWMEKSDSGIRYIQLVDVGISILLTVALVLQYQMMNDYCVLYLLSADIIAN